MKKITLLLLLLPAFGALSQVQQRNQQKERIIEQELEALAPAYVDEFKQATVAMDNQSYAEADSLYSIVYAKAPDFDPAIRRLGTVRVSLGKREEGIMLCERALELNRSSANIIMLVSCLVTPVDSLGTIPMKDLHRSMTLLQEGKILPDADEFEFNVLIAQVAIQLNDLDAFRTASNLLLKKHSDQMVSHYFAANLAASDGDWVTAEREIRIAHKKGLSAEEMNDFLDSGITSGLEEVQTVEDRWSMAEILMWVVIGWAGGFLLLYIVGLFLSFYTLRAIEEQIKTNELQSGNKLRSVYKILINSAGFYYYISLPIVLILVLAIAGVIVYTFFMIGQIPIKILLILVIGVGITVFGMLRSLFLKADATEPGRQLKEEEAPGLFALTKEVAATMGTRPIDEIRITPDTDLAVYETGSWKEKLSDSGKRILILGTGVLKDFDKKDFRAILAHEYGHFTHRDTAGGGVALRVRKDMANYYMSLYMAGQATWWNIACLFLRFYHFIFQRISAGATRLQEVLADRVAAQTYGAQAFENGLRFVVKRNLEFASLANTEIDDAEATKRPYNNLYELSAESGKDIEKELELALNRKTSEDDTHPSPADRFRYVSGITESHPVSDSGSVSDLFTDWNALTAEMTDTIRKIVAMNKQHMQQS